MHVLDEQLPQTSYDFAKIGLVDSQSIAHSLALSLTHSLTRSTTYLNARRHASGWLRDCRDCGKPAGVGVVFAAVVYVSGVATAVPRCFQRDQAPRQHKQVMRDAAKSPSRPF